MKSTNLLDNSNKDKSKDKIGIHLSTNTENKWSKYMTQREKIGEKILDFMDEAR